MRRMRHSKMSRLIDCTVVLVFVISAAVTIAPKVHAQKISQAISVAVVPFVDLSGRNSVMIASKAADAVALALDESQQYVVTPLNDTERAISELGVTKPDSARFRLSREQMVRLGERLRVEKVCSGSVDALQINKHGQCRCRLTMKLLDIATEEYLAGATADYTTTPIPGWEGEEAPVINEALRSAAEECLRKIQTGRVPRGNVDIVADDGTIIVNLGARDGIEVGMELLVVRGVWNSGLEKVMLHEVGVIRVDSVEVNECRCRSVSGSVPRTSDKCYKMYRPTRKVAAQRREQKMKRYATIGIAVGLLFAVYNTATGPDYQSAPGARSFLSQAAPGAEPRIRVQAFTGHVPDSTATKAWLVYRGESAGFIAQADDNNRLIAALMGGKLGFYEDDPSRTVDLAFTLDFTYLDRAGEEEDGEVDITYNHAPLVAGHTYYYKLRRVVDPGFVDIPIADTGQDEEEEYADVDFTVDPPESLGEASAPAGPVTYFYPPQPQLPSNGNTNVDPRKGQTTFRWDGSVGADTYQVVIFDNPQASGHVVHQSPRITTTGGEFRWVLDTNLEPETQYYWFVAARRSGEANPQVRSNNYSWILSEPYAFTTAPLPPPPPNQASAPNVRRPARRSGLFGERPLHPMP